MILFTNIFLYIIFIYIYVEVESVTIKPCIQNCENDIWQINVSFKVLNESFSLNDLD